MSVEDLPETPPDIKSTQPTLTPQFCFNTTALRDFLRLSRSTLDDSISAHINSLITPATAGFSPSSTSNRSSRIPTARKQLSASACTKFKRDVLFPSWQARSNVIMYCRGVARSPEPESVTAPDHISPPTSATGMDAGKPSQYQTGPSDLWARPPTPTMTSPVSKNYWGKEQVVDERTDPYSARDYSYTREPRQQVLADVLQNEEGVESIVRARTWSVLLERCVYEVTAAGSGWEREFDKWRREHGR